MFLKQKTTLRELLVNFLRCFLGYWRYGLYSREADFSGNDTLDQIYWIAVPMMFVFWISSPEKEWRHLLLLLRKIFLKCRCMCEQSINVCTVLQGVWTFGSGNFPWTCEKTVTRLKLRLTDILEMMNLFITENSVDYQITSFLILSFFQDNIDWSLNFLNLTSFSSPITGWT